MDRAMVHPETEDYESFRFVRNVPFECIPKACIDLIQEREFEYQEFLDMCPKYNTSDFHWNLIGYTSKGNPMVVVWGTWDSLEKHMRVVRVISHPLLWAKGFGFLNYLLTQVRLYASELQAKRLFWESHQWEAWLRILKGNVKLSNAQIIEVY